MPFYLLLNIGVIFISIKYITRTNRIFELSPFVLDKYNITEREKEICNCIINGFSNKEICDKLFISIATVKKHIYNLFLKTDAKNRIDLINILKNTR
jgi:DNA-binding CsgD family transcriptional regulator